MNEKSVDAIIVSGRATGGKSFAGQILQERHGEADDADVTKLRIEVYEPCSGFEVELEATLPTDAVPPVRGERDPYPGPNQEGSPRVWDLANLDHTVSYSRAHYFADRYHDQEYDETIPGFELDWTCRTCCTSRGMRLRSPCTPTVGVDLAQLRVQRLQRRAPSFELRQIAGAAARLGVSPTPSRIDATHLGP